MTALLCPSPAFLCLPRPVLWAEPFMALCASVWADGGHAGFCPISPPYSRRTRFGLASGLQRARDKKRSNVQKSLTKIDTVWSAVSVGLETADQFKRSLARFLESSVSIAFALMRTCVRVYMRACVRVRVYVLFFCFFD